MKTENKILQAAETVFLEKGFDGARTNEISELAGVNHALLHYYFRNKEKLFEAVLHKCLSELADTLETAFSNTESSGADTILEGVRKHFEKLSQKPLIPRFIVTEVFSKQDRGKYLKGIIEGRISKVIDKFKEVLKTCGSEMDAYTLFYDILALNSFPFLTLPMNIELGMNPDVFLQGRVEENLKIIKSRILTK